MPRSPRRPQFDAQPRMVVDHAKNKSIDSVQELGEEEPTELLLNTKEQEFLDLMKAGRYGDAEDVLPYSGEFSFDATHPALVQAVNEYVISAIARGNFGPVMHDMGGFEAAGFDVSTPARSVSDETVAQGLMTGLSNARADRVVSKLREYEGFCQGYNLSPRIEGAALAPYILDFFRSGDSNLIKQLRYVITFAKREGAWEHISASDLHAALEGVAVDALYRGKDIRAGNAELSQYGITVESQATYQRAIERALELGDFNKADSFQRGAQQYGFVVTLDEKLVTPSLNESVYNYFRGAKNDKGSIYFARKHQFVIDDAIRRAYDDTVAEGNWELLAQIYDRAVDKSVYVSVLGEAFESLLQRCNDILLDESIKDFLQIDDAIDLLSLAYSRGDLIASSGVESTMQAYRKRVAAGEDAKFTVVEERAWTVIHEAIGEYPEEQLLLLVTDPAIPDDVKTRAMESFLGDHRTDDFEDVRYDAFDDNAYAAVVRWYDGAKKRTPVPWYELSYFVSISDISQAVTRNRLMEKRIEYFRGMDTKRLNETDVSAIDDAGVLAMYELAGHSSKAISAINDWYAVEKSTRAKQDFLARMVNLVYDDRGAAQYIFRSLLGKMEQIDSPEQTVAISEALKEISTIHTLYLALEGPDIDDYERHPWDDEYSQARRPKLNFAPFKEAGEFLASKDTLTIADVHELSIMVHRSAEPFIREMFHADTELAEHIAELAQEWPGIVPVLIFVGNQEQAGNTRLVEFVAEMLAHVRVGEGSEVAWKQWRYRDGDPIVDGQIGNLTPEQRAIWTQDQAVELGDILLSAETKLGKAEKVHGALEMSIKEGHLYREDVGTDIKFRGAQERLLGVVNVLPEDQAERARVMKEQYATFRAELDAVDALIAYPGLKKMVSAMQTLESSDELPVTRRTENAIKILSPYLSAASTKQLRSALDTAREHKRARIAQSELLSPEIRAELSARVAEIRAAHAQALEDGVAQRLGIDLTDRSSIRQLYAARAELGSIDDVMKLLQVTNKDISANRYNADSKKSGESLSDIIARVKKQFGSAEAFIQDMKNIETQMNATERSFGNSRLAMYFTDDPEVIFQIGKYPKGCGSCQNYEGAATWNKALPGYVGDAHIKVGLLFDINQLSDEWKERIDEEGLESVIGDIPKIDILEASVAREMTKLVDGQSALFLEPTYSTGGKIDTTKDKYFNMFFDLAIAQPMGIDLLRGGGDMSVTVPASRNPEGQYEDNADGGAANAGMGIQQGEYTMPARKIDRFAPVTDEDRRLAEMISSGSGGPGGGGARQAA